VNDDLTDQLRAIADEWLARHGDPFPEGVYSSSANPFLHLCETAFGLAWLDHEPPEPAQPDPPAGGFHLYRLWAEDGRLLYVGVSTRLRARLRVHHKRWGDLIHHATWEAHDSERAMLEAERQAVRDEDPALNRALV
jgi:hypothetical protein